MTDNSMLTRHRPTKLSEVSGHATILKSLGDVIAKEQASVFCFGGPSGTGKTTLARIVALKLGATTATITDIDAATVAGVEATREIVAGSRFGAMSDARRAFIIDECHQLSKQAWDTLLKTTEEPNGVIWIFCTTNLAKVPKTMRTRAITYELQPLKFNDLMDVVQYAVDADDMSVDLATLEACCDNADGSARQALNNLAKVSGCKDAEEAKALLTGAAVLPGVIDLCRIIANGKGNWGEAMKVLEKLDSESPEGVRIQVINYLAVVLKNAKSNNDAIDKLQIIEHWATPYDGNEKMAPLYISIGRSLFSK